MLRQKIRKSISTPVKIEICLAGYEYDCSFFRFLLLYGKGEEKIIHFQNGTEIL